MALLRACSGWERTGPFQLILWHRGGSGGRPSFPGMAGGGGYRKVSRLQRIITKRCIPAPHAPTCGAIWCRPVLNLWTGGTGIVVALEQFVFVLHTQPEGLGKEVHGAELGSLRGSKMSRGRWEHNSCTNSLQNPEQYFSARSSSLGVGSVCICSS